MTDPYGELLALAEREHALVVAGDFDALAAVASEREVLMAALPARVPPSADATLRLACAVQAQTCGLLDAAARGTGAELGRLHHGRTATRGYGRAGLPPAGAPPVLDVAG